MTQDWDPKVHTPSKTHPEGWALIIAVVIVLGLGISIYVGTPR